MTKSKAEVSDKFTEFEARNTTTLKEARTQEKMSFSNPLPIGHTCTAVISNAKGFQSKAGVPVGVVEATVINDSMYDGKVITAAFRQFKDTEKQTAADAYANFLDSLEDLGLSRGTRENAKGISEMFDELLSTSHFIQVTVVKSNYGDGKQNNCIACPPPEGMSGHVPKTETAADTPEETEEDFSDLEEVLYLKKPHYKLEPANEDGTWNLRQKKGGKIRESIPEEDFEVLDD